MADQPLSDDANQASYGTNTGGPANAGGAPSSSRKMQATKAQVDEVVDIMRNNVEAVLERDAKISMMDDRADALHQGASQFETQAAKLKNKFWLENMKYMIALGVVVLIFAAVAIYKYKDTAAEAFNAVKGVTGQGDQGGQPQMMTPQPNQNFMGADNGGGAMGGGGGVPQQMPQQQPAMVVPGQQQQAAPQVIPSSVSVNEQPAMVNGQMDEGAGGMNSQAPVAAAG